MTITPTKPCARHEGEDEHPIGSTEPGGLGRPNQSEILANTQAHEKKQGWNREWERTAVRGERRMARMWRRGGLKRVVLTALPLARRYSTPRPRMHALLLNEKHNQHAGK